MLNEEEMMEDENPSCLICVEELKPVERNFHPCACAFRMCQCCWFRLYDGVKRVCPGCRRDLKGLFELFETLQTPIRYLTYVQFKEMPRLRNNLLVMVDIMSHFEPNCPVPVALFRSVHVKIDEGEIPVVIQRLVAEAIVSKGNTDGWASITIDAQTRVIAHRCLGSRAGVESAVDIVEGKFGRLACLRNPALLDLTMPHALSTWTHIASCPDLIRRYLGLSTTIVYALDGNGRGHEALDFATSVLAQITKIYGEDSEEIYDAMCNRAFMLMKVYKFEEAYGVLEKFPPASLDGSLESSKMLSTLYKAGSCKAWCLSEMGRVSEALILSNDLLKWMEISKRDRLISSHQASHIISTLQFRKARILTKMNRDDEALDDLNSALTTNVTNYSMWSPKTGVTKKQIALIQVKKNNFEKAMSIYEEIRSVEKKILTQYHPQHLVTAAGKAAVLNKMGKIEKAFELCQRTLTTFQPLESRSNALEMLMVKRELAQALVGKKRLSVAKALLNEILEHKIEILGERHPFIQQAVEDVKTLC